MTNKYIKIAFMVLLTTLVAMTGKAQVMSELMVTELQDIDVSNSMVTVNGKRYKYQPNKKKSIYRDSETEYVTLRSLVEGRKYYFDIKQEYSENIADKKLSPDTVVFITEKKLPE